jgi:hypothetical protein
VVSRNPVWGINSGSRSRNWSGSCGFGSRIFAGLGRDAENAPIRDLPAPAAERVGSTLGGSSLYLGSVPKSGIQRSALRNRG